VTYLDLSEPKGKLKFIDPKTGKLVDAKKVARLKAGQPYRADRPARAEPPGARRGD
jgi:hypothetical protein